MILLVMLNTRTVWWVENISYLNQSDDFLKEIPFLFLRKTLLRLLIINSIIPRRHNFAPKWYLILNVTFNSSHIISHFRFFSFIMICKTTRPLPPMLHQPSDCERCYQASECMAYHSALESGTATSSKVHDLFNYALKGVSKSQIQYLTHWER